MKRKLKVITPYGISGSPQAYRPHLVDPELSQVTWRKIGPETTQYRIRWMCGSFSTKYKPRLFMELPIGSPELCRACVEAKKNRRYWAGRGYSFDQIRGLNYRDQQRMHAEMLGKPMGIVVRRQDFNPPF